jgi:ParB family chromosome partitioning protein
MNSSKQRRGGLGRGLGALIPTSAQPAAAGPTAVPTVGLVASAPESDVESAPAPVPGASFAELPVAEIHPNAKQPRQVFDEDALAELTHSIREFGVLQPVVVRPDESGYELVMGERRLRAAVDAGLDSIPAIVRSTADDAMLRDALLENIHRAQLNPLEEAAAYQQLLEEFGTTHEELAHRIGRSRPQVTNTIRLLNLPLAVQRRVAAGVLSAGHARALLGLDDSDAQDELAARIVAEGLSVRATEELVALAQRDRGKPRSPRTPPSRRITAPAVSELANKLSDVFDTRVRVDIGRRKGRITVEFASIDDLERIIGLMAPQVSQPRSPDPSSEADSSSEADPSGEAVPSGEAAPSAAGQSNEP